jgi:hypothetical protein
LEVGASDAYGQLLLAGRGLGIRIAGILFVRLMVSDHASRCGAELAVAGHVARNTARDGALDASFGVGRWDSDECE